MTDDPPPQAELPILRDPETFQLFCHTMAENCAGTLYGLIWMMLAGKVALKIRLKQCRAECLAWQSEVLKLRDRAGTTERAVAPLRDQLHTARRIIKELEKKSKG